MLAHDASCLIAKRTAKTRVESEEELAGVPVKTYEIRVLPEHPSSPAIYSSSHVDDHAAIRRAITLAKPGQAIEVWCGARCIYAGLPSPAAVH